VTITGYASTLALGAGIKAAGSGFPIAFHDHRSCPAPDIANGGAGIIAGSSVFIGGFSCGKITLGHLFSDLSCGKAYGFDLSVGFYFGESLVTGSKTESCECEADS
jgi:hypothetical protein